MQDRELVNLDERARTAIMLGESHFREFKSALQGAPGSKTPRDRKTVCRDIGEALVAFANADGGELLIGVEDDGGITGVESFVRSDIEIMLDAPKSHVLSKTPLPPIRTATLQLDGHVVLYFSTPKSTAFVHLTSDGRCVQRRDLETLPIAAEEIIFSRRERDSREYDRAYVDGAAVNHLESKLVGLAASQLSPGMSNEKCLQYFDLAEYVGPGLRLKRAALLLFATEPTRWHPRLQLRIIKVQGTELRSGANYNVKSDQTVSGNILELIEKGWEALRPQLVQTKLGSEARFETTVMYPELACREALVNAIAHRDYSEEGRGIEIYVFDDRMEVRNPGSLLSSIKIDDLVRLQGVHQSRNASVARVLRDLGYMRELGEGMRRMFELMQINELTPPQIVSDSNSFCVTLRHSTIYTEQQKLWLEQFSGYSLEREQKAIVVLGLNGTLIAPQDIWDKLGIVDTEHYRLLILSLQQLGILRSEMSKERAQKTARSRRVSVRKIPRFRIVSVSREAPVQQQPPEGSRASSEVDSVPDPTARVYLGNLPFDLQEPDLVELLEKFGEVENLDLPKTPAGRTKGFAIVEFQSPEIAAKSLASINGLEFGGRKIVARKSISARKSGRRSA